MNKFVVVSIRLAVLQSAAMYIVKNLVSGLAIVSVNSLFVEGAMGAIDDGRFLKVTSLFCFG
jgi:hypothetical protein